MIAMMTVHTFKFGLALTVFLRAMTALRAGARGVPRVNERERNASRRQFVEGLAGC